MLGNGPTSKVLKLAGRVVRGTVALIVCSGIHAAGQATSTRPADQPSPKPTEIRIVQSCCGTGYVAAWQLLAEEIESDNSSHRVNAVSALALIGPRRDVIPLLQGALRDKDANVRKAAAEALGSLPAPTAKANLRAGLSDESPEVAFAAAHALWKMGDRSGRGILINTLDGKSKRASGVKSSMKENFEKYRDPKRLAVTGIREAAGAFAGPLPIGFTIAHELLKDRTASARAASAELLGKDPSPEAVEQLTEARFDKNWAVRASAAEALAVSPGKVSVEMLEPMLEDDRVEVRNVAAAGIIRRSKTPRPPGLEWPVEETLSAVEVNR